MMRLPNHKIVKVLRKEVNDQSIESVSVYTSRAFVYTFVFEQQTWRKEKYEGPLYIAKRDNGDVIIGIINNYADPDVVNTFQKESINDVIEIAEKGRYLMIRLRKDGGEVTRGIWFTNESDIVLARDEISSFIHRNQPTLIQSPTATTSTTINNNSSEQASAMAVKRDNEPRSNKMSPILASASMVALGITGRDSGAADSNDEYEECDEKILTKNELKEVMKELMDVSLLRLFCAYFFTLILGLNATCNK